MTPTDAQIEAAAKAMRDRRDDDGGDLNWYRQMAKTALTAAKKVEQPSCYEPLGLKVHVEAARARERERCAQVADTYLRASDAAAAIRALKDEP